MKTKSKSQRVLKLSFAGVLTFISSVNAEVPDWVLNPDAVSDGLAASGCAEVSGSASVDRQFAMAMARAELAKKIDVKVEVVDELLQRKVQDQKLIVEFQSASKQISEQSLQGSKASKIEMVNVNGEQKLCALVELNPENTSVLYRNLVKALPVSLSVEEEDALFD